ARPHDQLHRLQHPGQAIGQRAHPLGPACPEDLGDPRFRSRGQDGRVDAPVGPGRGGDDDLLHPRHPGGDRPHEEAGEKRRPATRHVEPRPPDRPDLLAQEEPRLIHLVPGAGHRLGPVEGLDPFLGQPDAGEQGRGDLAPGRLQLVWRDPYGLRPQPGPVQPLRPAEEGGQPFVSHLIQDGPDPLLGGDRPAEQLLPAGQGLAGQRLQRRPPEGGHQAIPRRVPALPPFQKAHGCSPPPRAAASIRASQGASSASRSRRRTGLAMSRAVLSATWAITRSRLASRVRPVWVRSRMASASPMAGASSMDPFRVISSTAKPCSSKNWAAMRGYLVATREWKSSSSISVMADPSGTATTNRQAPKPRSATSATAGSCSRRTSFPTSPRSAAPYST